MSASAFLFLPSPISLSFFSFFFFRGSRGLRDTVREIVGVYMPQYCANLVKFLKIVLLSKKNKNNKSVPTSSYCRKNCVAKKTQEVFL